MYDMLENDSDLNDESRAVIAKMYSETGRAVLGIINWYPGWSRGCWMWEWDGKELVCNFEASFVLPARDAELERLLQERKDAPYTGTKEDAKRIDAIFDRLETIGGKSLFWS